MKKVFKMETIRDQVFLILMIAIPVLCQTQMETNTQTFSVPLGGTAQLPCKINNLQASQSVIWQFVDHNQTISSNNDIRAENHEQKYSIYAPQDVDGFWNLEIYRVGLTDRGSYKCYVSGMEKTVKVVHHLQIDEITENPPSPDLNVTDCCVENGVGSCALPMCDTSTALITLFGIVQNDQCMEDNLVKVLTCGQDGRNHLGCCMRQGLSDLCQNLCKGYGDPDVTDYSSCIDPAQISNLVQCLKEGNVMLPSPPTGVSAINMGGEVVVTWQSPIDNKDVVLGYKVHYKKKGESLFNSTKPVASNVYMDTLRNLKLNEVYEIQVIAVASSGASQPSLPILIGTRDVIPPSNISQTIKECCIKQNVSKGCQGFCDASLYYTGGHPNILQCDAELSVIYRCIAGHGDHSPCCRRVQVPEICLGLCRGEPNLSWDLVQCLAYMPLISSCIVEGSKLLPDPPKNTRILAETVTPTSAVVTWQAPENSKPGDFYRVSWRKDKIQIYNWTSVNVLSGTRYELTGLEPTTIYDVVVATVNDDGSSLPELTLLLITEGVSNVPVTPLNETECCMERGVASDCLQMCVHKFRMTDQALLLALQCPDAIAPMLICGTDGRDHSECCRQIEGMPASCLDLCSLQPGTDLTADFLPCAVFKDQLSICFDTGKAILPRPPEEVTVKKIDVYSVVLDWKAPNGPNITNYTVEYSLDGTFWMKVPSTNHTFLKVDKLNADTMYNFRVKSNNGDGQSTPSVTIAANTLPVPSNKTGKDWLQLWNSREECCKKSNISSDCLSACVSGIMEDLDTRTCAGDIDKILACSADGRDHSTCCSNKIPGFSPACLQYCQGQSGSRDVESALCLAYLGPILTCFTEGQGLLPTPPQFVKAEVISSTEIHMKWQLPASNCNTSCYYITYIWEDSSKTLVQKYKTSEYTYAFSGLKAEMTYRVSVAAYNSKGMSLPSPYLILTTPANSPHTVSVAQAPSGVIDQGTAVQLECAGLGAEINSVKWIRNKQSVITQNLYLIDQVSSEDQGSYTCSIEFADAKVRNASLRLNVRYKPVAKKMTEQTVLPGVGQDAKLVCEFEGFPDIVTWSKDGNTLQGSSRYNIPVLQTDLTTGKTTSYLIVKSVVSDDFGSYTCSASNKFGEMHSSGSLRNLFPVTPVPTSSPPNDTSVSDCCHSKGVPDDCVRHICTYTIDVNNLIGDSSLTHCVAYLPDFFTCGADGKDHTKCCTDQGVQEYCLSFCAGVIPDYNNQLELLMCMPFADAVLNCAVNGQQYIPSQPRNVHAQVLYDTVRVFWDPPEQNAKKVDVYHVYYSSNSIQKTFDAASALSRSKDLPSDLIKKGETYTVWVKAINDFGSSKESEKATVNVKGLVPPAPSNLQGKALPDVSIEVTWEAPDTELSIQKYAVNYQAYGGMERLVESFMTSTRLINLEPNTKYLISVAAVSSDGVGAKTNVIRILTVEGKTTKPKAQDEKGGHESVGIAVGVVLGIVFVVAVAVVAVLLFRRLGRPKSLPGSQTVAFENPQYSTGQRVTGLPGEGESNQFQYGKLQEEHDSEHSYMTMQDSHTNDVPATLDLDQA